MFVGRRATRGKVRKGQKVRPLLGFQLNQRTPTPGEELVGGSETESSAGALPSSIPLLLSQTRQLADLQTQDTAGDAAGLTPVLQRLRRDTHIPMCVFCCGCCGKAGCGLCCRT
ncbi:hepcidin isoform X1 [Balaenoptera ricei]|uniref:hepcidin isoform X1 n=1 Tax=Balaenoptera ricei TaxID=2746895 RepID=UPI0028BD56C3|nr:hepcidin isoform X1 [Balaenoptera ricei]